MDVPFVPFEPDKGETLSMVVADSVLPQAEGYGPFPSLYVPSTATALPAPPRGIASLVKNDGNWQAYGFTASAFYQLAANFAWGAAVASGYSCPTDYDWSILHYGSKLLFTNTTDGLKSYDVETPAGVSSITAAGSPAWIFTIKNFVVGLNCLDSTGARNNRLIKTSALNDQTNWTTGGADYQPLADGGELLAGFDLKGGIALLLQQRALVLMDFNDNTNGQQFGLAKVADGKGAVHARSCVSFDGVVFYLATDGFYMFSVGGTEPIGAEKINRWFLDRVDQAHFELVRGAIDPLNKMVWWSYKRSLDSSTLVQEVLVGFDWQLRRWVTATEQTSGLTRLATVGVTYDAASGTYDSQTLTYDDRFWQGTEPLFGALDENYQFGLFTGTNAAATLTSHVRNSPVTGIINWATPIDDCATGTLEIGTKDTLDGTVTFSSSGSKVRNGATPQRARGMNTQFRRNFPAGATWSYARGVDHVRGSQGGPK